MKCKVKMRVRFRKEQDMAKYKDILGNTRECEDKAITISLERYNTLIIKEAIADGTVNVKEEAEAKLKELRGE